MIMLIITVEKSCRHIRVVSFLWVSELWDKEDLINLLFFYVYLFRVRCSRKQHSPVDFRM